MGRRSYAIKNIVTMLSTYIVMTVLSFFVRAVFVRQLGSQYLGLNGVLSSMLSVLSISDLGMESVFAFLLYKPLANKDHIMIQNFVALFRKVYNLVGFFILVVGMTLIPFLPAIIGKQGERIPSVTLIYVILLINSSISYLFTYNRTILNASQKNYIITSVNFFLVSIINICQIICLVLFPSMIIYVSLFLISTVLTNIVLSRKVIKEYPFLSNLPSKPKITTSTKKVLIHNTIGGLSNKLGSIIVFASDNILLSIFVNLSMVGLYSNYTLVMNSITSLIQKTFGTLTASVGNLSVQEPERSLKIFDQLNFYIMSIIFFVSPQLLTLLRPLIVFWLGEHYVLSQYIVLLIVINFALQLSRTPSLIFIDAYGLQWIQKWKSVIESILNIVLSVIMLKYYHMGLLGILIGTIGSTLLFVLWYEPLIVTRYAFKLNLKSQIKYLGNMFLIRLWLIIPTIVSWIIIHFIKGKGIYFLIFLMIVNFIISMMLFLIIFGRNSDVKYLYQSLLNREKN